jgi:hypothetical protein
MLFVSDEKPWISDMNHILILVFFLRRALEICYSVDFEIKKIINSVHIDQNIKNRKHTNFFNFVFFFALTS